MSFLGIIILFIREKKSHFVDEDRDVTLLVNILAQGGVGGNGQRTKEVTLK